MLTLRDTHLMGYRIANNGCRRIQESTMSDTDATATRPKINRYITNVTASLVGQLDLKPHQLEHKPDRDLGEQVTEKYRGVIEAMLDKNFSDSRLAMIITAKSEDGGHKILVELAARVILAEMTFRLKKKL